MNLGAFSLSLAVKEIAVSRAFYEKFGFTVIDGKEEEKWLMLRNGTTLIGLFQGMFEGNLITFNPPDVRAIQRALKAQDIQLTHEADETSSGPAYITLVDPDGNQILLDQHDHDRGE